MSIHTPDAAQLDQGRRGPGRPRSARADESIIDAVIDMLAEGVTAEALSMEAVASRAGVGKATIYRRWPNKDALLVDAVATLKGGLPDLAGRSVRDDLVVLLRPSDQVTARTAGIMGCLVAEMRRSDDLRRTFQMALEPRRQLMRQVLARGISTGELRPDLDVDLTMAMMVGPLVTENLLAMHRNVDRATLAERVVDMLWPAIAARPADSG